MLNGLFQPVKRPDPILPDSTLDEDLQNAADEANLTLYMINIVVVGAKDLPNEDATFIVTGKSDPYCVVTVGEISDRTPTIQDDLNPVWNEKMHFFIAKKPEKMTLVVFDEDKMRKDDICASTEFEFGSFFEVGGTFEGDLALTSKKGELKGGLTINVKCRTFKPVETEVKLGHAYKELDCLSKEKDATVAALDESEDLRKQIVGELSKKEQEILQKAAELETAVLLLEEKEENNNVVLSEKEKEILEIAERLQTKERKLTNAEEKILAQAALLEEKEENNKVVLSKKEKEILEIAERLEAKDLANKYAEERLGQVQALQVEVENELTAKEKVIQEQAKQIELKAKENEEALSEKDEEILEKAKELKARDVAAKEAQKKQDDITGELKEIKLEYQIAVKEAQDELDEKNKKLEDLKAHNEALQDQVGDKCQCPLM